MIAMSPKGESHRRDQGLARDLLGDRKWTDYLDYCDRFFWAVPTGFDLSPFEGGCRSDECAGLIIADRYDAEVIFGDAPCGCSPPRVARRRCYASPAAPRAALPAISTRRWSGWIRAGAAAPAVPAPAPVPPPRCGSRVPGWGSAPLAAPVLPRIIERRIARQAVGLVGIGSI